MTGRKMADPASLQHGKRTTYIQWGCRCQECKRANADYQRGARERRAQLLAEASK